MRQLILLLALLTPLCGQDYPKTEIGNGVIKAGLYLPDAEKGSYRSTRFDWSGSILSLKTAHHDYFGQWFDRYDPKIKAFYQRLLAAGKCKMKALTACMRKMLVIINARVREALAAQTTCAQ